jgi:hypothetical protein
MPGLFETLNSQVDDESGGLTMLDIADLPGDERTVMLSLMREQKGSSTGVGLHALHLALHEKVNDIEQVLKHLAQRGLLIVSGEAPDLVYRVNLRAKRGSNRGGFGLWSVLGDRLPKD